MKLCDVNPFIRFVLSMDYTPSNIQVFVKDCRIFYVTKGNADIYIENKHYKLCPNSIFYCCGKSSYKICGAEPFSLISINFDLNQSNNDKTQPFNPIPKTEFYDNTFCNSSIVSDSNFLNSHIFIPNSVEFYSPLKTIIDEWQLHNMYYREKCSSILKQLLIEMHRNEFGESKNAAESIEFVISYINSNFTKNINNKDLAALTGYHEYYLNRMFIKHTGIGMHKYIIKLRMNEASLLILNTDLSLGLIAEKVGFNNSTHFSSYFKKEFGISPSEYRTKFKNMI